MKKFFHEFKEFAVRGNVADLAVGIIIGGAFNQIVNSLVKDIIMPPISLLIRHVDFTNLFVPLNGEHYATIAEAQQAGAPTINYGIFINNIITFIITALAVFILIREMNVLRRRKEAGKEPPSPTTKNCQYCMSTIPIKATRCPQCTSQLS